MLSVALDVTPLIGDRTGIGVAVDGFIRGLAGRPEVRISGYGLTARGWRRVAGEVPPGVRADGRPAPAGALLRAWSRADWPPGEWWAGRADVVHGTNYVVPPLRRSGRVVSVWDMTPVRYPELCTRTSRLYPTLVARAVAGGAWIHTAAESVADEVVAHFGVARERVRVVPPVVPSSPTPSSAVPSPTLPARSGPGDGRPYILGLGRTEPRKDFPGLVRAFDALADRVPDVGLRIAGPPGWAEEDVEAAIASARHRDRIRRDGWVADVAGLMAGAELFAYPSVYEGFGLPPLEAMAAGVPVVATRAGAVPEVVGEAAVLVEPGDTEALADALESVLCDRERRAGLVAGGLERAARFTAERAAEGLISAYRDVAAAAGLKPAT